MVVLINLSLFTLISNPMYLIRFIIKCLFFLPIVFAVTATNFIVDPANLTNTDYEFNLAKIVHSGSNALSVKSNFDERVFQKSFINMLEIKRNSIVLGSSRSLLINNFDLNSSSFFNHSVSGSSIEDLLAIYYIYYSRSLIPDTVIIGLDPWLLNINNGQSRWKSIGEDYISMCSLLNLKYVENFKDSKNDFTKLSEIFSFRYFQSSIISIISKGFSAQSNPLVTLNSCDDKYTVKLADGSICYDKKYRSKPQAEINSEAFSIVSDKSFYGLNNFRQIDSNICYSLSVFIDNLKSSNTVIVFVLTPYHPITYNILLNSTKYKIISDCELWFRNFAKEKNIKILGSYNPVNVGASDKDFYDFMHPREIVYRNIFKNLH